MMMYEAVALADQNGRTYECEYGTYNKDDGFGLCLDKMFNMNPSELLNIMAHDNIWKLKDDRKAMTIEEIEKELGYKIKLKSDDDDRKKEVKEFLSCVFGIDI